MAALFCFLCFIWLSLITNPSFSQTSCAWDYDFTLEGAQGYEIQCIDDIYSYGYTPCMSYALCNGVRYQAVYFNRNIGQCLAYLAEWDDGQTKPKYYTKNGGQWTFHYKNGESTSECSNGVQFDINWICDELSIPFYLGSTCGQLSTCKHEMTIRSAYACVVGPIPEDDAGLSTGSLILILAFVAFILYCIIGYIVSAMKTEKDQRDWVAFKEHTPNFEFWTYGLFAYTKAGCLVSYEWINGKIGKKDGGDGATDDDYTLDADVDDDK